MHYSEGLAYKMEADSWSEPLNLVKKKSKPVAVVAPSSIDGKHVENRLCTPDSTQLSADRVSPGIKDVNNRMSSYPKSTYDWQGKKSSTGMLEALLKKNDLNTGSFNKNIFVPNNLDKDIFNQEKFADLFRNNDTESLKQQQLKSQQFYTDYLNCERAKLYDEKNRSNLEEKGFDFYNNGKFLPKIPDPSKLYEHLQAERSKPSEGRSDVDKQSHDFQSESKNQSKNVDALRPDGLYSMIHSLAACEQQFLTALYMNSFGTPNTLPVGYPGNFFPSMGMGEIPKTSTPVLSNLLSFADTQRRLWQIGSNAQMGSNASLDGRDSVDSETRHSNSETKSNIRAEMGANATPEPDYANDLTIPKVPTPSDVKKIISRKSRHGRKRQSSMDQKNSTSADNSKNQDSNAANNNQDKKKPHIKKPLNAFMLYMKEMRAKVVAECTLKESAAINQILGRRWHALGREEQAKYYELARRERQLHMQLYPDWSSRANSTRGKKRKRKQDTNDGGNSMKKCRARYGLDQQSQWCKPCRRKKKCIRYMEAGDSVDGNQSEDNLGSSGSVGDAQTPPDDDTESLHRSISSPGGLSGLSSLTSPSMILPSPSTSLASPSVSLASPCMSLQSPLTPHHDMYECKVPMPLPLPTPHRNPVGTNPHDINNPLSVNQLTGQCVKQDKDSRSVIGVT